MRIRVTTAEISTGQQLRGDYCPVALAIYKEIRGDVRLSVLGNTVQFRHQGDVHYRHLPIAVTNFMYAFDHYGIRAVEPFEFDLEIPEGYENPSD